MDDVSRRNFLAIIPAAALIPPFAHTAQDAAVPDGFPRQELAMAREIVGASHGNLPRVKELISARPALARASWDWGYGDWETALGAASHVGNKEIAAILIAAGAPPTIFSAAMLGQLDVVKSLVAAAPGIQKARGPHGITLLDHARSGGAEAVVKYLDALGDADPKYPNEPQAAGDPAALLGTYVFGAGPMERLIVSNNARGVLAMKREGEPDRNLFHHGGRVFNPAGAEAVRIRFAPANGPVFAVTIEDRPVQVKGRKIPIG